MYLVQPLEELIVSRDVSKMIKFTSALSNEQRTAVSADFEEQYGSNVVTHVRNTVPASSSTSLLINMWIPTKILRLRAIERAFKELDPLELAHCIITCPAEEFKDICDIHNSESEMSLYAGIRNVCIGQDVWKYLILQWMAFNRGTISNISFLVEQSRRAIEAADGKLFVDTMLSADSAVWPAVCHEYECTYSSPLAKDLGVFESTSALILSFASLFLLEPVSAIAFLLDHLISMGDNDGIGVATALYFEKWDGAPVAYLQYGSLGEKIREHFSSRYTEALKIVWKVE